ncbi:MAG: DMT family transporter, partial [Alistipes sp.]|nr:DMT family transporter [Alistipes sp.]
MWLSLAFASAMLLGLYDVAKKRALSGNAVLPVLLLNTLFCTLIFLPPLLSAQFSLGWFDDTVLESTVGSLHDHLLIVAKAALVLSSWIFGYYAIKHLPLTIVGPVNATRPIMVLVGAMLIFGERLNMWQWAGIALAVFSLYLLGRSSRREGVDFRHNVWVWSLAAATVLGAASGLYDKYVVGQLNAVFVQSWYNLYQTGMMAAVVALLWLP